MLRFIIIAVVTGLLFGIMDGLINANPFALKLMECFRPIAKQSINVWAGLGTDLVYGFAISGIFLLIMPSLPGNSGIVKGITYGLGIWFFRVVMGVVTYRMMFNVPVKTLVYLLLAGLGEMLILGIVNGLLMRK